MIHNANPNTKQDADLDTYNFKWLDSHQGESDKAYAALKAWAVQSKAKNKVEYGEKL